MAPSNEDDSQRLKARENAIETLIDMHPMGAEYRAARTLSEALKSNLESRHNRIPDWALLEHANSLSKYEILPQSQEVLGDLLAVNTSSSSSDNNDDADEQDEEESEKELKAGWETRLLRHHEKIIRAKNNNSSGGGNTTTTSGTTDASQQQPQLPTSSTPSSTDASKNTNKTAVPPPKLISVLRQLFDSPSSSDLKGILSNTAGGGGGGGGKSESQQVNVLPSLLHSVVNHPAFSSEPSSSSSEDRTSNVKRHLASLFHSPRESKNEEEGKATEETTSSSSDNNHNNTPTIAEIGPPPAANLEAIIGNVCRDFYTSSKSKSDNNSDDNRLIHGLLIASLSILTGSLSEEDTLEDVSSAAFELGSGQRMSMGAVPKSSDSSWNATPEPYLQVGGLLTLLKNVRSTNKHCGDEFLVDPSLSRYFAEASSVYEERIEIQKAALLQSGSRSSKDVSDEFSTPKNYKKMISGDDSLDTNSPLPPLSGRMSGHNSGDDSDDVIDLVDEGAPDDDGLPTSRHNSDLTNDEVANVTRMLLHNIANIVGGDVSRDVLDFHDVDMEEMGEDEEYGDEEDEEEEHQNMSDDDSEITREFLAEETGAANEDNQNIVDADNDSQEAADANEDAESESQQATDTIEGYHQDEEQVYDNDGENNNDDERVMLQRALALSLAAATTSSGGSDGSNSDNAEDDRKISAIRPPSERRSLKNEELKRKSSGDSTESGTTGANLPPFPAPPSKDVLPLSLLNDLSESEVTSLLDPTKLSSFGGVPSSHVLVQFLQILLRTLENNIDTKNEESATAASSPVKTPVSIMKKSIRKWQDESGPKDTKREFMPDAVTAQLLVALLQLSSYLRNCSIGALNDILSEKKNEAKESAEEGDDKEKAIQIANSAESEDPLDEDPVLIIAAKTALENKGFERKSAALADITALRQTTKEKMVGIWTERASFYSLCCYLCMRCLRILMSKCVQHGLRFSDSADSSCGDAIYMSTKSRNEIAAILASFHSITIPATFQSLQDSMDAFFESNIDESKQLFDELRVSSLCGESLSLWGLSIPFIYPDHKVRLELLRELIGGRFSLRNNESSNFDMGRIIESMDWNATNMQNMKLDLLCRRLRMSDMLDCFVPQPRVESNSLESILDQDLLTASLSAVRMLGELSSEPLPNAMQLYFAICGRAISSLILWNNFALSPSEGIDQDIGSLKMELDPKFHFDPSKCADSIAIAQPHTTANQRASKVWGTVLSTTHFLPKSGIHRFAVKLDKCERGHIFVGVATARANTKSYVGGDKDGWGFIGTQALWHDRNKIRGDYGSVLRTGAVIVATLDTDLGTLSYGLWKDTQVDQESSTNPMSPSFGSLASPPRGAAIGRGSMIEDWGIAFEGLPLDAKLYPAVGLYQRDDRATLYSITSSSSPMEKSIPSVVSSGHVYFPSTIEELSNVKQIRSWNQALCSNGIAFATEILLASIKLLSSGTGLESSIVSTIILPRLASALCLIPSCIPTLSAKYAMELLPIVTRCAKLIDCAILAENKGSPFNVKMKEGSWLIQLSDSDSSVDNEYIVDFTHKSMQNDGIMCIQGKGTCSTKRKSDGLLSINGAICGSSIQFMIERSDKSGNVSLSFIDARLSIDGQKFDGVFLDAKQNTKGKISGVLQPTEELDSLKEYLCAPLQDSIAVQQFLIKTESILCLAVGHLSLILSSPAVMSDIDNVQDLTYEETMKLKKDEEYLKMLLNSSPVLSSGRLNDGGIRSSIDSVWERCKALDINEGADIIEQWQDLVYLDLLTATDIPPIDVSTRRRDIESKLATFAGEYLSGNGSFSRLCPDQYNISLKQIATAILYHHGTSDFDSNDVQRVFVASRQIMESEIRNALCSVQATSKSKTEICHEQCIFMNSVSEFMYEFLCVTHKRPLQELINEFSFVFKSIRSKDNIYTLKRLMAARTEKSIMAYVGIRAIQHLLSSDSINQGIQVFTAAESALIGLHKLLPTSKSSLLSTTIAGCSSCVQKCVASSVQSMYDEIESMVASIKSADDLVPRSSFLLVLYTSIESRQTMLDNCSRILSYCKDEAFRSIEGIDLVTLVRVNSAQRVIRATTAFLESYVHTKVQQEINASVDSMLQVIVQELKHTVPIVEESYNSITDQVELMGIGSDWNVCKNFERSDTATIKETSLEKSLLAQSSPLLAAKNALSPSHGYFSQILDLVHSYVHSRGVTSTELIDTLLDAIKATLPPCSIVRILRLLRPILLATEANAEVIEQLFEVTGVFSIHLKDHDTVIGKSMMKSDDNLRISEAAVALLRNLYGAPAWQHTIHAVMTTSYSFQSVCGVVSFTGGLIGCLQAGSFLIIQPDVASSLSSSSTSYLAGKTKTALGGNSSTISNSAGKGVEGIISGLCRQNALAGILCNTEPKSGMCEVMVMPNRLETLLSTNTAIPNEKVTPRAIRVSCAEIAAAAELPLCVTKDMLATNILGLLLDQLKSSSSLINNMSIKVESWEPVKSITENLPSLKSLFCSAMSMRSLAVLLSDPDILQKQHSEHLQDFLSLVLHLAYKHSTESKEHLSKLPAFEARLWHLLLVKSIVQCKKAKLDQVPVTRLEQILKQEPSDEKKETATMPPSSAIGGYRTPPPSSLASSFFGLSSTRTASRTSSASTAANEVAAPRDDDDDEESQNAAHLREAAIVQMAELGLPRQWAELALRRTGDIESAVHFCLERGADMERLIAEDANRSSSTSSRRRVTSRMNANQTSHLISQLVDMGFPRHWCVSALSATSNNVDEALTWILTNGERLAAEAEDEEKEEEDSEEEDDNNEGEDQEDSDEISAEGDIIEDTDAAPNEQIQSENVDVSPSGWRGSLCPIRFISGKSRIDPLTLDIAGLKDGGFSSVGTKGVLLTSGKWYYEAELVTAGCLQIGWADSSFVGHCQADRGDGCGDGPSSWAFDGWRRYRWHSTATEWGCRWSEGDVVGCLVDMDNMSMSFTLNGKGEEIGMGLAFSEEGFRPCSGVYCCVSFNSREKLRLVLGGEGTEPFKYKPNGYRGVGEAILDSVKEREILIKEELPLANQETNEKPPYICDLSDGEHGHELFSWQHRYYGSDASVHLGGSRALKGLPSKKSKSNTRSPKYYNSSPAHADIASRLTKIFEKPQTASNSNDDSKKIESAIAVLKDAYTQILADLESELKSACASLNYLYAQKLVLHLLVAHSSKFTTSLFEPVSSKTAQDEEISRQLYTVIENTASMSTWLGEAGAMAVAAEALGLGISTYDNNQEVPGMCQVTSGQTIVTGGISQFLSSAVLLKNTDYGVYSPWAFAAASEATIGSDSGGSLPFIRQGLQNALVTSSVFRNTLLAGVRKAIRILAVTEFSTEDGVLEDDDATAVLSEPSPGSDSDDSIERPPDARLVCFMTGLLLSDPVKNQISESENEALLCSLFEGWCVGLLSASAPWRMICATTAAGILNLCPASLAWVTSRAPTIARYFRRLESTTSRRIWAERAAIPICSKYCQALIELLTSVKRALRFTDPDLSLDKIRVDAATPLPFTPESSRTSLTRCNSFEWDEGWISSNDGWEVMTGTVEIMSVEWKTPQRSIVRTLMDGGEGPPFLDIGCVVMRGLDWDNRNSGDTGSEDGQDVYEKEKQTIAQEEEEAARREESVEENPADDADPDPAVDGEPVEPTDDVNPADENEEEQPEDECTQNTKKANKKKKTAKTKLPVGTVIGIEPWNGVPAMARRVRWHLTGEVGVYRYGGDGGRFDIAHVEVNEKETRIKKRHPLPESMEQIASRYGFGQQRTCNVILRIPATHRQSETEFEGILEWPDYGAGIQVECIMFSDGAISITEKRLLYGSKDSGWEARFGGPSYTPGTCTVLSPIHDEDSLEAHEKLLGSSSYLVRDLRKREDNGSRLRVTSEMRLYRTKKAKETNEKSVEEFTSLHSSPSQLQPICFDLDFHAPSLSLSKDRRTVTCSSSEGRGTAFGNVGFTTGVHYWEVKIEKAEIGSIFIGVSEKPGTPSGSSQGGSSFGFESKPRLNRWLGWGFVNFRATYSSGAERVYGSHCHSGDTVGVMLDCDRGRISYFYDGMKYGEHILNDLGCAFENVSPFGFNADGCGSGGAGQGAPSGVDGVRSSRYPSNGTVRPRALWPVIGLRHPGDRVTFSSKWMTSKGVDGLSIQRNVLSMDEVIGVYSDSCSTLDTNSGFPQWFVEESFEEYKRWQSGRWLRSPTRGSGSCQLSSNGLDVDFDTTAVVCAAACASIGLPIALLPGDKIDVKRCAGRLLELQEEAVILGAYQGRLWYRLVSQKSEGGSLMEGGGRAWFWDESEAVEGGLVLIGEGKGLSVELPKLKRFRAPRGGLKIVFAGGAVVRSDLEIFDGSENIGTIPYGTVLPESEVIERRVNSCGVVRFLINHEPIGRGWISGRIRGGKEEPIVEILPCEEDEDNECMPEVPITPEDSAKLWYEAYAKSIENDSSSLLQSKRKDFAKAFNIQTIDEFDKLLLEADCIGKMKSLESDSFIASTYGKISDVLPHCDEVDCPFVDCAIVLAGAISEPLFAEVRELRQSVDSIAHEVALESLVHVKYENFPTVKALLARISMLRAFNRRARYALPWFSLRSSQEGSACFGGLSGFGASLEKAGRTWNTQANKMWIQVPSASTRLRECKTLIFPSIKRSLLDSIMETTATPTPLSHDEYELPREVRTVRVNRLKARQAIASESSILKRKHSVFSQLQREMRGWSGATFRRGFVAKGHGGQKRAFKVKLVGEGVNDYSGPYREVFTDAMSEVTDVDTEGMSSLGMLEPTPNNEAELGDGRDLFMFAKHSGSSIIDEQTDQLSLEEREMLHSFSSLTCVSTEQSREVEDSIVFLGKLAGTACRHSIPIDLPLPLGVVWDRISEESFQPHKSLHEIDLLAYNRLKDEEYHDLAALNANNTMSTQRRLLNFFADGLSSVLPVELLTLFTGEQLRDIMCGNPEIDVELLLRVVEYEGYSENDDVVSYLWDVLREMTTSERKLFLQFVWARNRLPLKEADFDAPFRIQKDTKAVKEGDDYPLPSASTCFFSLMLPEYPSKDMLKEKLLFAIENVTTMESDYVTNDVEVSEGWRGL